MFSVQNYDILVALESSRIASGISQGILGVKHCVVQPFRSKFVIEFAIGFLLIHEFSP